PHSSFYASGAARFSTPFSANSQAWTWSVTAFSRSSEMRSWCTVDISRPGRPRKALPGRCRRRAPATRGKPGRAQAAPWTVPAGERAGPPRAPCSCARAVLFKAVADHRAPGPAVTPARRGKPGPGAGGHLADDLVPLVLVLVVEVVLEVVVEVVLVVV